MSKNDELLAKLNGLLKESLDDYLEFSKRSYTKEAAYYDGYTEGMADAISEVEVIVGISKDYDEYDYYIAEMNFFNKRPDFYELHYADYIEEELELSVELGLQWDYIKAGFIKK